MNMTLRVNKDGTAVELNGTSTETVEMCMQAINSVYRAMRKNGNDAGAAMLNAVFHDEIMVDAMFTESEEEQCDVVNRMNQRILESLFKKCLDGDDGDSDESE